MYSSIMSTELEEFAEIANNVKKAIKNHSKENLRRVDFSNWIPNPTADEDDEEVEVGKLCQYSSYGTGFTASTSTIKNLSKRSI